MQSMGFLQRNLLVNGTESFSIFCLQPSSLPNNYNLLYVLWDGHTAVLGLILPTRGGVGRKPLSLA